MTNAGGELRRSALDEGVDRLRHEIADLAERVNIVIERSIDSLARLDPELAETVIDQDRVTNALRFAIEDRVVSIVAADRPVILSYEAVRTVADPTAALLSLLRSKYEVSAELAGWERPLEERAPCACVPAPRSRANGRPRA